jgi:tight adherence protein B
MPLLLALLTFVIVVLVTLVVAGSFSGSSREKVIHRRLDAVRKAESRGSASMELQLLRDELLSSVPVMHRLLLRWPGSFRLRDFVTQAGMQTKPSVLLLWCGIAGFSTYLLLRTVVPNLLLDGVAGGLAAGLPLGIVAIKRTRRLRGFEKNFPEAIDLLSRAVRAGHAFTTGMEMIGRELPEPVAGEFRQTFEQQNFGLSLKDALLNLTDRVPLIDVRFFVIALLIQKESGGNLAEILDNLSTVIRERFKILGEVRIKTAHGRLTAGILIALPPIMMGLLGALNPDYIGVLFKDPWGPYLLAAALSLQVLGSMLLWKIVHIEV